LGISEFFYIHPENGRPYTGLLPSQMYEGTSNNVGIGVAAPAYDFEIANSATALNVSGNLYVNSTNVGIGTASPGAQFSVYGTSTIGLANLANARILAGTTASGIGIDSNEIVSNGNEINFGTIGAHDIRLFTQAVERMRINGSNGYVGIGTITPTQMLEVNGSVNITGSLILGNANITVLTNGDINVW
jgi:hypothetical protein